MTRPAGGYSYTGPLLGGTLRCTVRQVGPRTIRATGVLAYLGGLLELPVQLDLTLGVKLNDRTGAILRGSDIVQRILELIQVASVGPAEEGKP